MIRSNFPFAGAGEQGTTGEALFVPVRADEPAARTRVLLLAGGGNRERLIEHLHNHEVIEPDQGFPDKPFDIVVSDLDNFRKWRQQLVDAKIHEEPVFLPVILIVSRADLRERLRPLWDAVDEFVVAPLDRREFSTRIAMLLRARHLALVQRAQLSYVVNHDPVTGLHNKTWFMDRLVNTIRKLTELNRPVHVTVVQVPLAHIAKLFGHRGHERAAIEWSSRLRVLLGDRIDMARVGSETWGLVHPLGAPTADVLDVCNRIRRISEEPLVLGEERIRVSPRIGIGIYPDDGADADALLDCAISALGAAQGSEPALYSRRSQDRSLRHLRVEARLHEAMELQQLELWFQPQVRLSDRAAIAVEALIRWRLPNGELVPPIEFIPVAEASGLLQKIDRWVLNTACASMHGWRARLLPIRRVAVNLSSADIRTPDFTDAVERTLKHYGLPPDVLELELTETTLFEVGNGSLEKVDRLRRRGLSIVVDDFGTGYSSLSYLHRLPVTGLKVDKSFIAGVDHDETNAALTRAVVGLARDFGLETIAEGIETEAEAEFLKALGVVVGQGFLYARPMPEPQLRRWLSGQG